MHADDRHATGVSNTGWPRPEVSRVEFPVVLFDLFDTLVPGGTREQRDAVSSDVGRELGVDGPAFAQLVSDTLEDRMRGRLGDLAATLFELAARLGSQPSVEAVARAVTMRLDLNRSLLQASWALPVLDQLRADGVTIGVVSDCSAETPAVWHETALAARVTAKAFSCELGVRKPDPEMYLSVTRALSVRPQQCVFVGDGAGGELAGARALGMRTIWFDNNDRAGIRHSNKNFSWDDERITSLTQLRELLHS